jgi:hypothetical protein
METETVKIYNTLPNGKIYKGCETLYDNINQWLDTLSLQCVTDPYPAKYKGLFDRLGISAGGFKRSKLNDLHPDIRNKAISDSKSLFLREFELISLKLLKETGFCVEGTIVNEVADINCISPELLQSELDAYRRLKEGKTWY